MPHLCAAVAPRFTASAAHLRKESILRLAELSLSTLWIFSFMLMGFRVSMRFICRFYRSFCGCFGFCPQSLLYATFVLSFAGHSRGANHWSGIHFYPDICSHRVANLPRVCVDKQLWRIKESNNNCPRRISHDYYPIKWTLLRTRRCPSSVARS